MSSENERGKGSEALNDMIIISKIKI